MQWNSHSQLEGKHSFLSASKYQWTEYDDDKFDRVYSNHLAAKRGTDLHNLAKDLILLGVKLPRTEATLNMYVNDAIGFRMKPEQILFYSYNSFGCCDAISWEERKKILRIHDLKTGVIVSSVKQLEIYAALWCLEYRFDPFDINEISLRIYQNDEIVEYEGDPAIIALIMEKIKYLDARINMINEEVLG